MNNPTEIENDLLGFLQREVLKSSEPVDRDADLVALGFDSMSLVRMLLFVEKKYGIWISEEEIANASIISIASVAGLITQHGQKK
jgi:acyl carrier protein